MHVDTASDIDDNESAADSSDLTEDDATLSAMFKASGLPASLKVASLSARVLSSLAGRAIASTAFASSSSAATSAALVLLFLVDIAISSTRGLIWRQAKFKNQRFKLFKLKSKKFIKIFMLGTDDDGNLFSLDSSFDIFSENDDGDYDNDFTDSPGEAEMNALTTDVDSIPTPASDDLQADLFGVIPPPASAHAVWTDPCDEIDMCTDPTVHSAIA
eukprot:3202174-Pleurochrysis_carterae.AAC.1